MRRLSLALVVGATAVAPLLATSAAAAPPDPLEKVDVFVRGDGSVCVTYDDLSTVCTASVD
ncbi:MAG: hypothetical protein Q8R60_08890 [Mycobacteriales bacterium]|nr:hypothetical protein [Mycobacteriales bacterium]